MNDKSAARLLVSAAKKDFLDNPQMMAEAGRSGNIRALIMADAGSALRDQPGPTIFPNLRSAVTQIAASRGLGEDEAVGTNDAWAAPGAIAPDDSGFVTSYGGGSSSSGGVPGMVTSIKPAPAAAQQPAVSSSGDDWTKALSSIVKSAADAGSAIYTTQIKSQAASKQASLLSKLTGLLPKTGVSSASILGGSTIPILLIGGVAIAGAMFFMKNKSSNGGTSRRRSKRRR